MLPHAYSHIKKLISLLILGMNVLFLLFYVISVLHSVNNIVSWQFGMNYFLQLNELYILLQKQASKAIFKEFFYERMLQTV